MAIPSTIGQVRDVFPKLGEVTDKVVFGDVWERKGLAKRDRSLITVASLVTQGAEEQLRGHLMRALNNGVTKDEIKEVFMQAACYAGVPSAVAAFRCAREVFASKE